MNSFTLQNFDAQDFLANYWQRRPLLIKQAIAGFEDPLSPDELAGLALEPDVESRLITANNNGRLQVRHGPLEEVDFQDLNGEWTLLVQACDQVCPEARELLRYFQFLPDWRIDDVMASYAPIGGGVGPHFDKYDVFLLQGAGSRRWRLGQRCDATTALSENSELKILRDFKSSEEHVLEPGDILYVPPGLAHWGESVSAATTWSIGFRSPAENEILSHFCDHLIERHNSDAQLRDPIVAPRLQAAQIQSEDLVAVQQVIQRLVKNPEDLALWYGELVTEKKYPTMEAAPDIDPDFDVIQLLKTNPNLVRAPDARLAFIETSDGLLLFYNGQSTKCSMELKPLVDYICKNIELDPSTLLSLFSVNGATGLLKILLCEEVIFYD
ncbi:MAG: 50S ribosomal protein L16 3-hydroxylase [Halieaceae bacterium]|jgi:50S ribosomal protein L16 3-hydroxylase